MKELEDDWAQAQFEEANRIFGPPAGNLPPIEPDKREHAVSREDLVAALGLWQSAAQVWQRRALASEARWRNWRRQWYWRLAGACILISAIWWWSR